MEYVVDLSLIINNKLIWKKDIFNSDFIYLLLYYV